MSKIQIEISNLNKSFKHLSGSITLFNNFNIKIKEGELVALVGPSGSGKTSLLHLIALLDEPTYGKIILNKIDTKKLNSNEKDELRRKNISIIFQDHNLLTDFTAIENIKMPLIIKNENKEIILKKAEKILKDLKIFDRSNHFPNQLSGGEQQRVAIARAISFNPEIILADEPTGNLDRKNTELVSDLLLNYSYKKKISLILVTHNMNLAKKCDRVIKLFDGRIEV